MVSSVFADLSPLDVERANIAVRKKKETAAFVAFLTAKYFSEGIAPSLLILNSDNEMLCVLILLC